MSDPLEPGLKLSLPHVAPESWSPVYRAAHSLPLHAILTAIEESRDGVMFASLNDPELPLVFVNRSFEQITGYSRSEAIGKTCRYLQGADREQPEIAEIRDALAARRQVSVTLRNYRKDGALFWNELRLTPVHDVGGKATHFIGFMRDVTELRHAQTRLQSSENYDQLTNVLNRYGFARRIDEFMSSSPLNPLVIKIDVARFREFNSGFGFDLGDLLPIEITRRLETFGVPAVARMGADEFGVLIGIARRDDAENWIQRLDSELTRPYALPGAAIEVRFATGYVIGSHGAQAKTLISRGGNRPRAFQTELAEPCQRIRQRGSEAGAQPAAADPRSARGRRE